MTGLSSVLFGLDRPWSASIGWTDPGRSWWIFLLFLPGRWSCDMCAQCACCSRRTAGDGPNARWKHEVRSPAPPPTPPAPDPWSVAGRHGDLMLVRHLMPCVHPPFVSVHHAQGRGGAAVFADAVYGLLPVSSVTTRRSFTDHIPTSNRPHADRSPTSNRPHDDPSPTNNRPHADPSPTACRRFIGCWLHCVSNCSLFRAGNCCPVCLKVYRNDESDLPMVCCDECDRWIHTSKYRGLLWGQLDPFHPWEAQSASCQNISERETISLPNYPHCNCRSWTEGCGYFSIEFVRFAGFEI